MIATAELKEWADSLTSRFVAIGEDGLSLIQINEQDPSGPPLNGAYLEVGGQPLPEENDGED